MRRTLDVLGAFLTVPALLPAQDVVLGKPSVRVSHPFSAINGFRELPDGRVIVSDGIDNVLMRIDLTSQKADTLGRPGQGPGEYKAPDGLFPLPDGATLVVDLGNGRLSVLEPTGTFRESTPIALGSPGSGEFSLVFPRATDAKGRIYYQPMGAGPRSDSAMIVRWDRGAGTFDSIARVRLPSMIVKSSGGPNNRRQSQRQPPYAPQDLWTVAPDGRVALIRAPVYRVDWVPAAGARIVGPALPSTAVPVRDSEKKEYLAESAANGLSVSVANNNGTVSMQFTRGRAKGQADDDEPDLSAQEWPATKPVVAGVVVTDPAGRLWVERSVPAGAPRSYDVIGPDAKLIRKVTLPVGRRLIGVGAKGLYAKQIDADGISYLERYQIQ